MKNTILTTILGLTGITLAVCAYAAPACQNQDIVSNTTTTSSQLYVIGGSVHSHYFAPSVVQHFTVTAKDACVSAASYDPANGVLTSTVTTSLAKPTCSFTLGNATSMGANGGGVTFTTKQINGYGTTEFIMKPSSGYLIAIGGMSGPTSAYQSTPLRLPSCGGNTCNIYVAKTVLMGK